MDIREEFEKLPEIRDALNEGVICFMNHSGWYKAREFQDIECEQYVNGAWYAFQEKQREVDALKAELAKFYRNGFKMVPLEPTDKMVDAACDVIDSDETWTVYEVYNAMIGVSK